MDIFDYVEKYSGYTFSDMEFNEVDNLVFSSLSYINFFNIVSSNSIEKIIVKMASDKYFNLYPEDGNCILSVKYARRLLKLIENTKRYGSLLIYNYVYEYSDEQQFGALTIELNNDLVYVSFEGTDHLISGWKEDFMALYMFPIRSQKMAIKYINSKFLFNNKKIILGGHSKGGNLAMVAGMYANFLIRDRIIKIYSNDGFGLPIDKYQSKNYDYIKAKLVHIIPEFSLVGILLYHDNNYKVVKSFAKGPVGHDLHTWCIKDKALVSGEISQFSHIFDNESKIWLNKYNNIERKRLVLSLFDIFTRAKVDSLIDIMDNKKLIFSLINEAKEISDKDRDMLIDFVKMLFNCYKDVKKEQFIEFFEKRFGNSN